MKGGSSRAAFAPGTVKGRQAHPPKAEKTTVKRIPRKEKQLALFSAIAATASKQVVASRGHRVEDVKEIPLVVTDDFEALTKTNETEEALIHLGLLADVYRAQEGRKVRAGKGKSRGRKMKRTVGPLIVIAENKGVAEAARNVPGIDVTTVSNLNVEMLAPGTHPGRLTVWTCSAIEKLGELYGKGGEE
jgi:large subunit ribosomal protein L4e